VQKYRKQLGRHHSPTATLSGKCHFDNVVIMLWNFAIFARSQDDPEKFCEEIHLCSAGKKSTTAKIFLHFAKFMLRASKVKIKERSVNLLEFSGDFFPEKRC